MQDAALAIEHGGVAGASFRKCARERCHAKLGAGGSGGGGGGSRRPSREGLGAPSQLQLTPSPQQSEVLAAIGGLAAQMAEMRSLQTAQRTELAEVRAAVAALRR